MIPLIRFLFFSIIKPYMSDSLINSVIKNIINIKEEEDNHIIKMD
jgi:hypothetical protein